MNMYFHDLIFFDPPLFMFLSVASSPNVWTDSPPKDCTTSMHLMHILLIRLGGQLPDSRIYIPDGFLHVAQQNTNR